MDNTITDGEQDGEHQGCLGGDKSSASARDEGKYLRVKATYTDRLSEDADDERTAVAVSANPVRAEVSSDRDNVENPDNGSPGFTAGGDYERSVPGEHREEDARGRSCHGCRSQQRYAHI